MTADAVRLRNNPGTNSGVIGHAYTGDTVTAVSSYTRFVDNHTWVNVQYNNQVGWMAAEYLSADPIVIKSTGPSQGNNTPITPEKEYIDPFNCDDSLYTIGFFVVATIDYAAASAEYAQMGEYAKRKTALGEALRWFFIITGVEYVLSDVREFAYGSGNVSGGQILSDVVKAVPWEDVATYVSDSSGIVVYGDNNHDVVLPDTDNTGNIGAEILGSINPINHVQRGTITGSPDAMLTVIETWQEAEQYTRDLMGTNVGHLFVSTRDYIDPTTLMPYPARRVDSFNEINRAAAEVKYGVADYTGRVASEARRDAFLLATGEVQSVTWYFYKSQKTGKGGPTKRLLEYLLSNGINVVYK